MNYIPIKSNKDDVRNSVFRITSPKINVAAFAEVSSMYFLLGGIVNNVAGSALAEAKYHLAKSPFFCRKVKYYSKRAFRAFDAYEYRLKERLGERWQLFLDNTDEQQKLIHDDIERLYWAFRGELLKDGCEHATLIARTEVAYTMLAFSEHFFNVYFDTSKEKISADVRTLFNAYRVQDVAKLWYSTCDELRKQIGVTSDFQNSNQCRLALSVIENKIISPELVNKAGAQALRDNPKFLDDISSEDRKLLEEYL